MKRKQVRKVWKNRKIRKLTALTTIAALVWLTGCSQTVPELTAAADVKEEQTAKGDTQTVREETYENSEDGGHAIAADGETAEYSHAKVTKTGDSEGDEADFYGQNSAVFATNGAGLTLSDMDIRTDGTHANAVFSYGENTEVTISDSVINTTGNCSGGLMTTGGGKMNASNLTIHTTGNSSAAIRSDRGGGVVTVNGGEYTTQGKGSPAIYSTADITVNDADLTSTASEGVVVEGKNSVTLNNVSLTADHNQHNSDKSDNYHAVMIYQSMSGDADTGLSKFTANGGSITNANGDIFFVNNTTTDITLSGVEITNNGDGVFLRAAAAGWGNEGSNGGKVNLTASQQTINGDMIVDENSILNLYLKDSSSFTGAINTDGAAGEVYVELSEDSGWSLTADSNVKSLTCDADAIKLNGHTLTVDGKVYTEGAAMTGEAIEIKAEAGGSGGMQAPPDGKQPLKNSDGEQPSGQDMQPPSKDGTQSSQDEENSTSQGRRKKTGQTDGKMAPPDGQPPRKPEGDLPQKQQDTALESTDESCLEEKKSL
ncbi:MAG: hypothetical protein E7294_08975 [Lachnospiraceae bacterium]|nr:hypothetical protein [Lachnospiraceae bacterium]